MLSISFLNKLPFKGSYNGKRFLFKKVEEKENELNKYMLKVYIWKDLYNFENTKEEDMIIRKFPYTKEGIDDGIDFIEETKV